MILLAFDICFIRAWSFLTIFLSARRSLLTWMHTFTWTIWSCYIWTNCFISVLYTIACLSIINTPFSICYTNRKLCTYFSWNKLIAFNISIWSNIICTFFNLIKTLSGLSCWNTPTFNSSIVSIKFRAFRLSTWITRAGCCFRNTKILFFIITLTIYCTWWRYINIGCTSINSI